MPKVPNNIDKNFNRLSTVHERYRRQTDGWATAYSEREREFTLAKNDIPNYTKFTVTRSSSDDNATSYVPVLLVLWMTSYLAIFDQAKAMTTGRTVTRQGRTGGEV